jgi:hypothetical protein
LRCVRTAESPSPRESVWALKMGDWANLAALSESDKQLRHWGPMMA